MRWPSEPDVGEQSTESFGAVHDMLAGYSLWRLWLRGMKRDVILWKGFMLFRQERCSNVFSTLNKFQRFLLCSWAL